MISHLWGLLFNGKKKTTKIASGMLDATTLVIPSSGHTFQNIGFRLCGFL